MKLTNVFFERYYVKEFRSLLTGLLVLLSTFVWGQSGGDQKDPLDIIQASPTAQSLGTYGGVNVGIASGTVNKQILLYDFRSRLLNVPISVNYSSNGIKVNDNGGIVGTGWTASLGGVITRTVMGEQDEASTRLSGTFNPYGGDTQTLNYLKGLISYNVTGSAYDGEPDLFSFNFNGYAGKFILDANENPVLLNHSGLVIKRIDSRTFTITTAEGIRYEFGGNSATETIFNAGAGCGKVFANPHSSAFFLTKIVHPAGETINFVYGSTNQYNYPTGVQETFSYQKDIECPRPAGPRVAESECLHSLTTTTILLQEINSSSGRIVFSYKSHLAGYDKLLEGFKVYRTGESAPIREVKLTYLTHEVSTSYRKSSTLSSRDNLKYWNFLAGIQELNASGTVERKYGFSYSNLNLLPARFSNCQDYFGYFNGKNNLTLVPPPTNEEWKLLFPMATADREPNASFVSTGMLSKIVYPTGGVDSLVFEPNTVYKRVDIPGPTIYGNVTATGQAPFQEGVALSEVISPVANVVMNISLRCDILAEEGTYPGSGTAEILENGAVKRTISINAYQSTADVVYLSAGKTYQIRVKAIRGPMVQSVTNYSYTGAPTVTYQNVLASGVRIAKVFTKTSTEQYQKQYKYYAITDAGTKSTGIYNFFPNFSWLSNSRFPCPDVAHDCAMSGTSFTITASSSSRFGNFYFSSAPVYYSDVFEEDNLTNGGISYNFNVYPNARPNILRGEDMNASFTSNDDLNGLELLRSYFKKNGSQIVPVKEIRTTFKVDSRVNAIHKAYVAHERFIVTCGDLPLQLEAFNLLEYNHNQRWVYTDTIRTKEYSIDGSGYNETVELFYYDNPGHAQLSRKVTIGSDNNRTVNQMLYPDDYASGTAFIDDMKTNHLTAYPIEQVRYRESGSTRTVLSGTIGIAT